MGYRKKPSNAYQPKFTPEQVAAALIQSRGLVSVAAKKLKCANSTVYDYMNAHPMVKAAQEEAKSAMGDRAEEALFRNVEARDQRAIEFYLRTQHRSRGYVERHEFTGSMETPFTVNIVSVPARNSLDENGAEATDADA